MNDFAKSLMDKSLAFAVRIAKLAQFLCDETKEFVLSRQIVRSGTSIGANVREAQFAQSDMDFISKLSIALKEASETQYWLEVLAKAEYITEKQYCSLRNDADRLVGLLVKAIKSKKRNLGLPPPRSQVDNSPNRKTDYEIPLTPTSPLTL